MGDNKYVPLIIESDDADPIKYYSTSAAARDCGVTKQRWDYAHKEGRHRMYSADLTNLAGLQALLESSKRKHAAIQFLEVLTFASYRGVVCVAIWSQVKKLRSDQLNFF